MHSAHRDLRSSLAMLTLPLLRFSTVCFVAGVFVAKPAAAQSPRYQVVDVSGFWCSNALAQQGGPQGINDASQVVGAAVVPFGVSNTVHAVLWENAGLKDLLTLPNGRGSVAYVHASSCGERVAKALRQ
jgi:hypothetical protein